MATHRATIRAWITVEFEDDGISVLPDQASDAFDDMRFNPKDCDYEVMEVVELRK